MEVLSIFTKFTWFTNDLYTNPHCTVYFVYLIHLTVDKEHVAIYVLLHYKYVCI